jgi:Arc/MetJ-type ribon-helix-helix transcriptional regulator
MAKDPCLKILDDAYSTAASHLDTSFLSDADLAKKISMIALCASNRAGARFLLAATLAKIDKPTVDIRKPFIDSYQESEKADAYGGRNYDEQYVTEFITERMLPCNSTTAFLTPAFRTKNIVLDLKQSLRGRPAELYQAIFEILDAIQSEKVSASDVLNELLRRLIIERDERQARLESQKKALQEEAGELPLSSEDTIRLIEQHLALRHSSRLPVLVVAAAYRAAAEKLGERVLQLHAHTAADKQTGALGDVEITLMSDDKVVTAYEMKDKPVTKGDIDIAIQKIVDGAEVQNYIFVTTAAIDPTVREYANQQYRELGGVEIAVLDCIGFLRHFLHLFHRLRTSFLDEYQELVLSQPESAVNQALKEAFLALRKAAQAGE